MGTAGSEDFTDFCLIWSLGSVRFSSFERHEADSRLRDVVACKHTNIRSPLLSPEPQPWKTIKP